MHTHRLAIGLVLLACVALLPACQSRFLSAPVERHSPVPLDSRLGVTSFAQPLNTSQLITGLLPEKQGRVPGNAFPTLDLHLRADLAQRPYIWLPVHETAPIGQLHDAATPQALPHWIAFGRQHKVDLLLVPHIIDWHQREGSGAGVTSPAHVKVEFYLIDARQGRLIRRSIFEERQVGLTDNLLTVGDFVKRKGAWITAEDLTREATAKALKELGL